MVNYLHSVLNFKNTTPAQKIASSFLLVILVGTILLMLPMAHHDGEMYSFIDALFTATSATCVTGLVLTPPILEYTLFGQVVIMSLIQIGGLGLMTLMAVFILLLKSKLSMHEKIAMKEMLNQERVPDMHHFLFDILRYTLMFEGTGMLLLSIRFVPEFGFLDGMFKSMFIAVSAFCNAGFDVLGTVSLGDYVHDPLIIFTVMSLIVLGGLGFAVWFDLRDKLKPLLTRKIKFSKFRKSLNLHTRIVLDMTFLLIVSTAVVIFLLEFQNQKTLGTFSLPQQVLTSMFESVTLRTAGFASIDYAHLALGTKFLMILVMFIGGSPGGTAGGIKTTTVAVLCIYIVSTLRGRSDTVIMRRTISKEIVIRAMGIFFINLLTLLTGIFILCILENQDLVSLAFEAASAMATVGLSLGITASLSLGGKIVIIMLMFVGRIGITTFVMSLVTHGSSNANHSVAYPSGNIIVG